MADPSFSVEPGQLVLSLAFETYADTVQRGFFTPDALVDHLLHGSGGGPTLIADPWRSRLGDIRRRPPAVPFPSSDRLSLLSPKRLVRHDPRGYDAALRTHRRYLRQLVHRARTMGMTEPRLIATHPFTAAAAQPADWAGVTYLGWDDWLAHPHFVPYHPALARAYAQIAASGHDVVGVSGAILDRIPTSGRSLVMSNGLRVEEWTRPVAEPDWLSALPRPRYVYCGAIDSRLDVPALQALAEAATDGSIVLVGPVESGELATKLAALPRVTIAGTKTRDQVRAINFGCDVGLIPHADTELTRAMSPLKLYEYGAAGLPIVARDLQPIRQTGLAALYRTPAEFAAACLAAAAGPRPTETDRQEFIRLNSWRSRFEQLFAFVFAGRTVGQNEQV